MQPFTLTHMQLASHAPLRLRIMIVLTTRMLIVSNAEVIPVLVMVFMLVTKVVDVSDSFKAERVI